MTTTTAESLSCDDPVEVTEHLAIAGFLAGYTGARVSWPRSLPRRCVSGGSVCPRMDWRASTSGYPTDPSIMLRPTVAPPRWELVVCARRGESLPATTRRTLREVARFVAVVRVLIADDHPVYRDGLAGPLADIGGFDVIGLAADGHQAVDLTDSLQPDAVVMDLRMPVLDGVEATRQITARNPGLLTRVR